MPPKCSICYHPDRQTIDQALVSGETLRDIAQRFAVSRDALYRHKAHIPTAVAKAHGGTVSASSGPGEGTTITIVLPLAPDQPA